MREVIGRGTLNRRSIWGLAAAMALFVLLMGMPSMASAGKSHLLKIYKVEKHLDLQGAPPGNYAHEHVLPQPGRLRGRRYVARGSHQSGQPADRHLRRRA